MHGLVRRAPHARTLTFALRGALALVAALLLAGALPVPAQAENDYPRLGLYGHVNGRAEPLVTATGELNLPVIDVVAKNHFVILDASPLTEYRSDILEAIRARNPAIVIVGYVQGNYIWPASQPDSNVHLPTVIRITVRNLNGFLYSQAGHEYPSCNLNLAKRDAQGRFVVAEALADIFVDRILATGKWDGLFFDRFCQDIQWMQSFGDSIDYVRAGYPNYPAFQAAWSAGTDTMANRMRRRAGPVPLLIGNCGNGTQYASFNGWLREDFPNQNGASWQTNMLWNPGGYLPDQARFRPPYSSLLISWPNNNEQPYTAENVRRARLALASATLGDGFGRMNPPQLDWATGYMTWWFDEFAVNRVSGRSSTLQAEAGWLGHARGPARQVFWVDPNEPDATVINPGFESSVTFGWIFQTSVGATVTRSIASAPVGMASARITVPSAANNVWSTSFTSSGSIPYGLVTYSALFWAKASVPRTIWVNPTSLQDVPFYTQLVAIDTTWRQYQVLFPGEPGTARIQFRVGGTVGDVWLDDVHFQRGAPSVWRRDFDYGTVLVNPSLMAFDVPMEKKFRRITGLIDPQVNSGQIAPRITVAPRDGVFLLKTAEELVAVDDPVPAPPGRLAWSTVSPIPARAGAETVRLNLAAREAVAVDVALYDARGRRVRTVFAGPLEAGTHALAWDGRDEGGRTVAPGLYFARARAGEVVTVKKLVLR